MVITLIGYRGSGKSTVAGPLAEALGWDWIDADVELEQRAGKSIRRIFDDEGEPKFREWEESTLLDLLGRRRWVIAAGGGAPMNPALRSAMKSAGPVVWLQASVDLLEARILSDATTAARRPSLTAQGGRGEIESLLKIREPIYRECATQIVETDGKSVSQIVSEILAGLPELTAGDDPT